MKKGVCMDYKKGVAKTNFEGDPPATYLVRKYTRKDVGDCGSGYLCDLSIWEQVTCDWGEYSRPGLHSGDE